MKVHKTDISEDRVLDYIFNYQNSPAYYKELKAIQKAKLKARQMAELKEKPKR